ncbi:hypothetical protein I316_00836 [Kwoniella heveanensis BCC8398]|uniref:Uncharacterized protein n=1 Tax=Kwoniella heveanensis BCC8398 TaxID=1296120 RepID=A0A1B9H372_9TREE|nr:hypothetical protein I316_00836 [Kwoniella heveanensis BCC8398]
MAEEKKKSTKPGSSSKDKASSKSKHKSKSKSDKKSKTPDPKDKAKSKSSSSSSSKSGEKSSSGGAPYKVVLSGNTIKSITAQKGSRSKDNGDAAQWLLYWIVYTTFGWMRGAVSLWRPHWRGVFEVGRTASLVVIGGAWFGRKGLKGDQKGDSKR